MTEQYIYGPHAVDAILNRRPQDIKAIYINQDRQDQRLHAIIQRAIDFGVVIERLQNRKMLDRFGEGNHQGIVARAIPVREYGERDLTDLLNQTNQAPLILILDGVTDPHNLGACLRSADAAGVSFVVIPKDNNATLTPVVSKVACGATETMPIVRVTNLVRALEILKQAGVWIYGAAGEANDAIYTLDGKSPIAIVMGAGGEGLRRLTREHCDGLFALPMLGSVTSLNVSVATGIALYEIVRQRLV